MFKVIFVHKTFESVICCLLILSFKYIIINFLLRFHIHELFDAESLNRVTFIHVYVIDYMQYLICFVNFMVLGDLNQLKCVFRVRVLEP